MKIKILLFCIVFLGNLIAFADTIELKSGKTIEGPIIERTSDHIKIDVQGVGITYYLDEIDTIQGQKITSIKPPEQVSKKDQSQEAGLPFKTAIINYVLTGNMQGVETDYIDTVKNKVVEDITSSSSFDKTGIRAHLLNIYDGKSINTVSLDEKTVNTMLLPVGVQDVASYLGQKEKILSYHPFTKVSVLGKECRMYDSGKDKEYFWHGILLKNEAESPLLVTNWDSFKEATSIQLDVPISSEKFDIPAGLKTFDIKQSLRDSLKKLNSEDDEFNEKLAIKAQSDPQAAEDLKLLKSGNAGRVDMFKYYDLLGKNTQNMFKNIAEELRNELVMKAKIDPGAAEDLKEFGGPDGKINMGKYREIKNNEYLDLRAKENLLAVSRALESYAKSNGNYPVDETDLTPTRNLCGKIFGGSTYDCSLSKTGYTITAKAGPGGLYTITTGGILKS